MVVTSQEVTIHSWENIWAKNIDITKQQTGNIQLLTCTISHRDSLNTVVGWRQCMLYTNLKWEHQLARQRRKQITPPTQVAQKDHSHCAFVLTDRPYICLTNWHSQSSWNIPKVGSWRFATVQSSGFMVRIIVRNTYRKWCCFRKWYCKST